MISSTLTSTPSTSPSIQQFRPRWAGLPHLAVELTQAQRIQRYWKRCQYQLALRENNERNGSHPQSEALLTFFLNRLVSTSMTSPNVTYADLQRAHQAMQIAIPLSQLTPWDVVILVRMASNEPRRGLGLPSSQLDLPFQRYSPSAQHKLQQERMLKRLAEFELEQKSKE